MNEDKMKPILILKKGMMLKGDIEQLRANGICVVEAADPSKVNFLDPIPSQNDRGKVEQAAIKLSRILLTGAGLSYGTNYSANGWVTHKDITKIYVDCLVEGTPLDKNGTVRQQEEAIFSNAKIEELRRLGIEEARAERARAKAEKQKQLQPSAPTSDPK